MKKIIVVTILLVCAMSSAAVYSAWAQFSMIGVKAGDNFTYSFSVFWSSTNPDVVVPAELSNLNQTISIHVNITDVGPTMAYVTTTSYSRDGTKTNDTGYVEVVAGRGTQNAQLLLIAANLTAGDKVYPSSDPAAVAVGAAAEPFTITETIDKTYLGIPMTVNHYFERVTNSTTGDYVNRDAYYDKATGIMLEMTFEHYYASAEEVDRENWKITQLNNAGTAPSDGGNNNGTNGTSNTGLTDWLTIAVIAAVVVVVAALAVVIMMRRRKKPQTQTPPSESVTTPPQTSA
jgi:hypothetical protein